MSPYLWSILTKNSEKRNIENEELLDIISTYYGFTSEQIMMSLKIRKRELVTVRQIYMFLKKERSKESLANIGLFLKKDHATVLHAKKVINNLLDTSKHFRQEMKDIRDLIEQRELILDKIINKYA